MKQKVVNIVAEILKIVFVTLYRKPRYTISLLLNRQLWDQRSYYPEKRRKSRIRIFIDQLFQIWKYGAPNEFYFLYGLDVKCGDEYNSYIHYTPFMQRRDELNLQSIHNSIYHSADTAAYMIWASRCMLQSSRLTNRCFWYWCRTSSSHVSHSCSVRRQRYNTHCCCRNCNEGTFSSAFRVVRLRSIP